MRTLQASTKTGHKSCVSIKWYRSKTYVLTDTFMFIHATHWAPCCLHSLARLAALNAEPSDLLFPKLSRGRIVTVMNLLLKEIYETWQASEAVEVERRLLEEEEGIYADEEPFVLSAGLTTHGNRAGCMHRSRSHGIPDSVALKHCGMKSSGDTNASSYDHSIDFESDAKVSKQAFIARC